MALNETSHKPENSSHGKSHRKSAYQSRKFSRTSPILALKRLYSEYEMIKQFPLSHVSACPSPMKKKALDSLKVMNIYREMDFQVDNERDFMLWHVNIRGPEDTIYDGAIFHATMSFTENYPMEPPIIRLSTRMEHPNVVDSDRICLDFLEKGEWKPIYSIHSILMQLQTFLYDGADIPRVLSNIQDPKTFEEKKEEYLSAQEWSISRAKTYVNRKIGHSNHLPVPTLVSREEEDGYKRINCESVEKVIVDSDSACFFTKTRELVGYGISCKRRNEKSIEINDIHCSLEILSLRAFMNYQVRGMTKDPSYTHWIPIIQEKETLEKTIHIAKSSISRICSSKSKKIDFSPNQVIEILPRLMSNCLLQVIDQREKSTNAFVACLRIFKLMIEMTKEMPDIGVMINESIGKFIAKEESNKTVKNLLDFVMLVPFSTIKWKDLYNDYMREYLTRYIKKILKNYKEIADFECTEITNEDRVTFSFKTIRKRLKELLLHIYFVQIFSDYNSVERISQFMDENSGTLPYQALDAFIEKLNQIEKMNDFATFFRIMNDMSSMQLFETQEAIIELLKSSIESSLEKGYHGKESNKRKPIVLENLPNCESEHEWRNACSKWKIKKIPYYMKDMNDAWEQLYLQKSMSSTLREMAVRNDFSLLTEMLEQYSKCKCLEFYWFEKIEEIMPKICSTLPIDTFILKIWKEMELKGYPYSLENIFYYNNNNVVKLICSNCKLTSDHVRCLIRSSLINIETLDLGHNNLGDEGAIYLSETLRSIRRFPKLTYLDVSYNDIEEEGTNKLGESLLAKKNLKTLKFTGNKSPVGLYSIGYSLSYSYTIEEVRLNNIKGDTTKQIEKLYSDSFFHFLQEAKLKKLDLSDLDFEHLTKNVNYLYGPQLEYLNLSGSPLSFSYLENLCQSGFLENLDVSRNAKITNETLDEILQRMIDYVKSYTQVDVSYKFITLKDLNLSGNNIQTDSSLKRPLSILLKYSTITRLNVSNCSLQALDLDTIAESLLEQNIPRLKHLIMRHNLFKKHDLRPLVAPLQNISTLETLDISGNRIGEIGCRYISDIIKKNRSIKYLNMFGCMIDVPGISNILEGLKYNQSLEILDLGLNKVRNKGFSMIIELLKNEEISIKKLSLSYNNLSNQETLLEAMKLTYIVYINLKRNNFISQNKINFPTNTVNVEQEEEDALDEVSECQ